MYKALLFSLLLTLPGLASPLETLSPDKNVRFTHVLYASSETERDPAIEAAIAEAGQLSSGEEVGYLYNRVQLGPKGEQVMVLLISSQFVGSGGATMLILDRGPDHYKLVTRFTLTNSPILVCETYTKGWRDLVWRVRGGGIQPHYARLRFDGTTYPSNPSSAPSVEEDSTLSGTAILADQIRPGVGLKFQVK